MNGGLNGLNKAYKAKVAIPQYSAVIFDSEDTCTLPTADNQVPLGAVYIDEQLKAGHAVSVSLDRYVIVKAGDTVTAGDALILKTGGSIIPATSLEAGSVANVLGYAENSGITGDLITVRVEKKQITLPAEAPAGGN